MVKNISKVFATKEQIEEVCKRIGQQISHDYKHTVPILIGLLKGCLPFMADLMREISIPVETYYMAVSSYHGGITSSGDVLIKYDLEKSIAGRDVIIVEDVIDTGLTITTIVNMLKHRGPKSVVVATLLDKPNGRKVDYVPAYAGLKAPPDFLIGYGLDYQELYRNIPYIGILDPKVYQKVIKDE